MKRGLIFGVLVLVSLGVFVSADIVILEVDETSSVGVQGGLDVEETYLIGIEYIGQDHGVESIVLGVSGEITGKVYEEDIPYSLSKEAGGLYFSAKDIIDQPWVGGINEAIVIVAVELNFSMNKSTKYIIKFGDKLYTIELTEIFDQKAKLSINGEETHMLSEDTSWSYNNGEIFIHLKNALPDYPDQYYNEYTFLIGAEVLFSQTPGEEKLTETITVSEPGLSLEEAEVNILCNKTDKGYRRNGIDTYFKIKNNQDEQFNSTMYLKSDGLE